PPAADPGLTPTPIPIPITPTGKLSVTAINGATGVPVGNATVQVLNVQAQQVAKGLTGSTGIFSVKLPPGLYKVKVFADGYKQFGTYATIVVDQVTAITAGLQSSTTPPPPVAW